jgi:hypothetical protein
VAFLLDQSKEQVQRRIARQRWVRRIFWTVGLVLLAAQIAVVVLPAGGTEQVSAHSSPTHTPTQAPSNTPRPTATPFPTPTVPAPTPQPTRTPLPSPTPTTTATSPATGKSSSAKALDTSLDLISPPQQISEQAFQLDGTGQPGDWVTVSYHNSLIARAEVDRKGVWHVEVPTAPLDRGANSLQVTTASMSKPRSVALTFEPWWLDAPLRLQGGLGEGYACAPTVLGMAMDYYHNQDPGHIAPATTEIVQSLKKEGFIDGYGADAHMMVNLAISYGYSHTFFYRSWSQAHVRKMLDEGTPVIVNVRVGMSTEGYGHSVLVIGMSPDGKRVMVNDPAQGMVEYAWETLDRSWGSFGPPYRHGMVVKP